jgi:hypothetical protein
MALLDEIKTRLRIKNDAFDEAEIAPLIEAAKIDIRLGGGINILETDPLIKQAITLYCKAHFGFSEDSEKYAEAYEHMKRAIGLCGDYNAIP